MIYFVGAGPGAEDLITLRGANLLADADAVVYAGSLVNPALLSHVKPGCEIYDSAGMTLEEVMAVLLRIHKSGKLAVRLHTGDPCLYGAIQEQMDWLNREGVPYEVVPGVSSFGAAAAALKAEYTPPGVSQTVIITRMAGRTAVPPKEEIALLAAHSATMVIFLSAGLLDALTERLLAGGYAPTTPAAIVYKASWPQEKTVVGTLERLSEMAKEHNITRHALILVGEFLQGGRERSKLYDPNFAHGYRKAGRKFPPE